MTETSMEMDVMKEMGGETFQSLMRVLSARESANYNVAGWGGSSAELGMLVEKGELYPASTFAVVSEGAKRYKRSEPQAREDTDSMRELATVLLEGADVYGKAKGVDESVLLEQIKKYVTSHGGEFQDGVDWQAFIAEVSGKLKNKANAIDEVNR